METNTDPQELAEQDAREAVRLLAGWIGFINNIIEDGVHAILAVYYSAEANAKQTTATAA